jgi:hypothetical protein
MGRKSYWGGGAGRELMVLQGMGAASMVDLLSIMSYDAGYTNYDPVTAYQAYRAIMPAGTPVALGIESSPQGWSKAITMINEGNTCAGGNTSGPGGDTFANLIMQNQYGDVTPGAAYTIERFAGAVQANDGLMFWALFLPDPIDANPSLTSTCGGLPIPTVTQMGQAIDKFWFGNTGDPNPMKIDRPTAQNYGK